jgi:hypothetical protein
MIELRDKGQLTKAIERAKASSLLVQQSGLFRLYYVTNRSNGARYSVNFRVTDGKRFGKCSCRAGEAGMVCKHLAAAAGLHVAIAEAKRAVH